MVTDPDFDPYLVLEVTRDAAPGEIKAAFRKKAQEYHPDRVADLGALLRAVAESEMKKINLANEILYVRNNLVGQQEGDLLLLHVLYRGPERRIKKRVLIGHPIRAGAGLFKHDATLLELSRTGARLSLANPPKVGTTMQLVLGKELTNGKPIKIVAKVVRSVRAAAGRDDEIGLALQATSDLDRSIQTILDRFASGPASIGAPQRGATRVRNL